MSDVRFDHTIIPAVDKRRSAEFFTRIFGLDDPVEAGFFQQVRLSDSRVLDFAEACDQALGPLNRIRVARLSSSEGKHLCGPPSACME